MGEARWSGQGKRTAGTGTQLAAPAPTRAPVPDRHLHMHVAVHTCLPHRVVIVMDFHAHCSATEVGGLLAGSFDEGERLLKVRGAGGVGGGGGLGRRGGE